MGARAPIERQADRLHETARDLARVLRNRKEPPAWWVAVLRTTAVLLEKPRRHRQPHDEQPEEYVTAEAERQRKARYRVSRAIPEE